MNNEKGFLTVDFIFALVLVLGLTAVLFAMTFTLVVASVTQYITYAAARNYVVGHQNLDTQTQQAQAKYTELITNQVFAPLYKGGWFQVSAQPDVIGDASQVIQGYQANGSDPNLFWGVGTYFTAKILDFNIPFFGSTDPGSDGSGKDFRTFMGSYLGRDVTWKECNDFVGARWTNIQNLPNSSYSTAQGTYTPFTDNGC